MLIDILNKIFIVLFFLSSLNVIRHSYFIIQSWVLKDRYILSNKSLFLLGISLSYIISGIIYGITI